MVTAKRRSGGYGLVIPMPLSGLPSGPYLLQVEARTGPDGEQTTSRRIPIQVQ